MAVLKNVTLYWANLVEPNEMSGKRQVNVGNLTDEHISILTGELGIDSNQIREPKQFSEKDDPDGTKQRAADEQGRFIVLKSGRPVKVVTGSKKELNDEQIKKIGNGSVANVQVNSYEWDFKGKSGVSGGLQGIQLIKLIEYAGKDEFAEVEDELGDDGLDFDSMLDELETAELG